MAARNLIQVNATGDVTTQVPTILHSVTLTAGSDAATIVVKDGSGGTTKLTLKAAANTSFEWVAIEGVQFSTAVHATFTGTGPVASFEVG